MMEGPGVMNGTRVHHIMQQNVVTIAAGEVLSTLDDIMTLGGVRHMPVVRSGELVGVVSERDLLRAVLEHPEWREPLLEICEIGAVRDHRIRALLAAAAECEDDGVDVEAGALLARCEQEGAEALLSRISLEEALAMDWDGARNCALGIQDDSLRRRLKEMSKDIREALEAGDHERFSELNREKVSLAQRIGSA